MSLVLQSSGGGSVTLEEPTTASNFTQTLPAADGTVVITGTTPTLNGITFPATAVSSADANTLDDYEEGTWTPVLTSGTGSLTSYTASGTYVKIGRQVTLNINYTITNNGTGATFGNIGNFPFTVNSVTGASAVGRIGGTTGNTCTLTIDNNGTGGSLWTYNNGYPWATSATSFMTITYQTS